MATRQIPWARLWAEGVAMSRDEIMALPPDSVQPYLRALGSACSVRLAASDVIGEV